MKAYRYEDVSYSLGVNEYDDPIPGYRLKVELVTFNVVKKTPKGFWIKRDFLNSQSFVRDKARASFARLDKNQALIDFKYRKERQIQILTERLNKAKEALAMACEMLEKGGIA